MQQSIRSILGVALAFAMIVAALWGWRHAAWVSQDNFWAVRSGALALAAAAQMVAIMSIAAGAKDRFLRGLSFAAAGVCGVCVVSAAALGLAGR